MKTIIVFFLLALIFNKYLSAESDAINNRDTNIFKPKSIKVLHYKIDNTDSHCFGYKEYEDESPDGIYNIFIENQFLYLSDRAHNNIKRIDLLDGNIISSKVFIDSTNNKRFALSLVACFQGSVFVFTQKDFVFMLDSSLSTYSILKLPSSPGEFNLYSINKDSMFVYSLFDVDQQKNLSYKISLLKFYNRTKFIVDTVKKNYEEGRFYDENRTRGIQFIMGKKGDKWVMNNKYGRYELNNFIPFKGYNPTNSFISNIDFTKERIVFFEINDIKNEIILYSYAY